MKLALVLSTHAAKFDAVAYKGDFEANVEKTAALGYDGVELAVRDPALIDSREVMHSVARHGLAIPAIGTGQAWGEERLSFTDPQPQTRQKAVDRIAAHIQLARAAGSQVIIGLVRGILQPGVSLSQAREWMLAAFRSSAAAAAAAGVRLVLEPLNRYETPLINTAREALDFLDLVGADNLGLLLDTFHMNIEEPSIEESIRICGQRIFHFHVADSNRWYPGAGHLDFRAILSALLATGYQGFISGEFMAKPEADLAAQKAVEFLRGLNL
jgi:sugar phosphate isomerase/epimerase